MKDYEKEWLKDDLGLPDEIKEDEGYNITEEPNSQIQNICQEFFERLKNTDTPDEFDRFHENRLQDYSKDGLFGEILSKIADRLNLDSGIPFNEEDYQDLLFRITEVTLEEEGTLDVVYDVISDKYPTLITKETQGMSKEEYREKYENYLEEQIKKMEEGVEDKEEYEEFFESVRNTEIEKIAKQLNNRIEYGTDIWKILLYSMLSARANKIQINGLDKRSSIHTLLLGDISTAKSVALDLIRTTSPNAVKIDDVTKASFIGRYDQSSGEIQDGVVDRANDSNLMIEELDKTNIDSGIWRIVMDNRTLSISKGGTDKEFEVNMSVMAGANPKKDFFRDDKKKLIKDVPFRYGELSRFVVIPLISSVNNNRRILDKMNLFGDVDDELDIEELKDKVKLICKKIEKVEELEIEDKDEKRIKKFFENYNRMIDGIPLVIPRDLETIARFVNIIAITNQEPEDNKVKAREEDVDEALSLWETLMELRENLYEKDKKRSLEQTIKGKIYNKLLEEGEIKKADFKDKVVEDKICDNERMFYRKFEELKQEERVVNKDGKERNPTIAPVS